jgi:Family of unknown function (DUF6328)
MAKLKDKIENALNESRTLILGVQVLLGFQYQSVFQSGFEKLDPASRSLEVWALVLILLALGLLMSPAPYHRIVARGQDTSALHRFVTVVTGSALLPFALALAIEFFVALETVGPFSPALVLALVLFGFTLVMWYGLEVIVRMKRDRNSRAKQDTQKQEHAATPLADKVKQVLTEARIVLPGAQALLGFQFATMLLDGFARLSDTLKYIHVASLALIAVSTVLLMAPAAYHRLVENGEETESLVRFASRMVLAAMAVLALGIAGDFLVVVTKVFDSPSAGVVSALVTCIFFYGIWFGLTTFLRSKRKPVALKQAS